MEKNESEKIVKMLTMDDMSEKEILWNILLEVKAIHWHFDENYERS